MLVSKLVSKIIFIILIFSTLILVSSCRHKIEKGSYKEDTPNYKEIYRLGEKPTTNYNKKIPKIKNNEVTVSNIYEFVSVIGSNRIIKLESGVYDLDYLKEYIKNKNVDWKFKYDNGKFSNLIIKNVDNLTIKGLGKKQIEFVTKNNSNIVVSFINCKNITLDNMMIGHGVVKEEDKNTNECVSEIINFKECKGVNIIGCTLYGCGSHGIIADEVTNMTIKNSIIEQCNRGGVKIENSSNMIFDTCVFRYINGDNILNVESSNKIIIQDSIIGNNKINEINQTDDSEVEFINVNYINNKSYLILGFDLMQNEAIDFLKIGLLDREVIDALGEPLYKSNNIFNDDDGIEYQTWYYKPKGIELEMVNEGNNQRINKISIYSPCDYKTLREVGIGSNQEAILNSYKNEVNSEYFDGRQSKVIAGTKYGGIIFYLDNEGYISKIVLGSENE